MFISCGMMHFKKLFPSPYSRKSSKSRSDDIYKVQLRRWKGADFLSSMLSTTFARLSTCYPVLFPCVYYRLQKEKVVNFCTHLPPRRKNERNAFVLRKAIFLINDPARLPNCDLFPWKVHFGLWLSFKSEAVKSELGQEEASSRHISGEGKLF